MRYLSMLLLSIKIGAMSHQEQKNVEMLPENDQQGQEELDNENQQLSDHHSEFSQDFNEDNDQQVDQNPSVQQIQEELKQIGDIPKVSNPISAYGVFIKSWKQKHPNEKMGLAAMADIWKQMSKQEKEPYEKKFRLQKQKYEEYEAQMLAIDPNFNKKQKGLGKDFYFPLHRVKSIMKLDNSYSTSTENVCAMTKAVEYFGLYLLEEVKKASEGKKRIDLNSLFEAINNNQNNLWFLNCLIDQYTLDQNNPAKGNNEITKQVSHQIEDKAQGKNKTEADKKTVQKQTPKSKKKMEIPKGQLKLTDMF